LRVNVHLMFHTLIMKERNAQYNNLALCATMVTPCIS
jgi:hypothetical protein